MTTYLLDSNILIFAKNDHYGFDYCPGFWAWLEQAYGARSVLSVESVLDEVLRRDDALRAWAKDCKDMFLKPDEATESALAKLNAWTESRNYTEAAQRKWYASADYHLVAQASTIEATVVTRETPDPNSKKRVKIPDACKALGVACVAPHKMLIDLGARFILAPRVTGARPQQGSLDLGISRESEGAAEAPVGLAGMEEGSDPLA